MTSKRHAGTTTDLTTQAASALASFKMESPVKKLDFSAQQVDKENIAARYESDEIAVPIKGIPELEDEPKKDELAVAPANKEGTCDEPILMENPNRFVLFPIKYHEVSVENLRREVFV